MTDQITLTLPREREFHRVAHLVLSGIALRLELTIEALEDLQVGLGALLDRVDQDGEVTISMTTSGDALEARVGPLDVAEELASSGEHRLGLARILSAVADDVIVDGESVRLTKRVGAAAGG